MFRKLLLASVAALGLLSPLALPAGADAHESRHEFRHEHRHAYRVYYRDPCRPAWVFGGVFPGYGAAASFAEHFRCQGFFVSIR